MASADASGPQRGLGNRARGAIGALCFLVVAWFVAIWLIGQQSTGYDRTYSDLALRLYPGTWSPAARGFLWVGVGAAAVTFDLLALKALARSRASRNGVYALTAITGLAFAIFAAGSFADADWSVVH